MFCNSQVKNFKVELKTNNVPAQRFEEPLGRSPICHIAW